MPSRRVLTNGWTYWLARHPKYGVILYDRENQADVTEGCLRVFELRGKSTVELPQNALKIETTADVSDPELVQLLNSYNTFKISRGASVRAPVEEMHSRFLRERGLENKGVRQAAAQKHHRVTVCWSCHRSLDNTINVECVTCGWIICQCGACGCGKT